MMKMNTQFGDITITDENKTITNDALKKEIDDKLVDGKKANIFVEDEMWKEIDKE